MPLSYPTTLPNVLSGTQLAGPLPPPVAAGAQPPPLSQKDVRGPVGANAVVAEPRHAALLGPVGGVHGRRRVQGLRGGRGDLR